MVSAEWAPESYARLTDFGSVIEDSAKRYGDEVYLAPAESGIAPISFVDVERFARGFEVLLEQHGIGPTAACALFSNNSSVMVLQFLAIIASGRTCVPINPNSSVDEIAYIVSDSEVRAVLYEAGLEEKASFLTETCELVSIDQDRGFVDLILRLAEGQPERAGRPTLETIAEIVYTTGSTGRPKGVQLTHRNLLADMYGVGRAFDFSRQERFLTVTPLFHNSGQIMTTLIPLYCGGRTTAVRPDMGFINFWHYVDRFQPAWTLVMPSHIALTLDRKEAPAQQSLRGILCGGAKLDPQTQREFEQRFGVTVYANYGLTESTSIATCVRPGHAKGEPGSVGPPLDINEVRVVKENTNARAGVVGEIWIRGDNVFTGYVNHPELYAEKVIDGWLHTGDLGYVDNSGHVHIVDRIDSMVLVGGENVYPSEIERFVPDLTGISEAFVLAIPDKIMGAELVFVYRLADGASADVRTWKTYLFTKLPRFKVPRRFIGIQEIGLDDFPRSQSGKLLRKRLQNALEAALLPTPARGAPAHEGSSRLFAKVAAIVAEVLEIEVDQVRRETSTDNQPSWDSTTHMRLILTLEGAFGITFTPAQIIEMVRVSSIVGIIEAAAPEVPSRPRER